MLNFVLAVIRRFLVDFINLNFIVQSLNLPNLYLVDPGGNLSLHLLTIIYLIAKVFNLVVGLSHDKLGTERQPEGKFILSCLFL